MSFGTFLHTCVLDAKKAAHAVLVLLAKGRSAVDALAPTLEVITAAVAPEVALYERALVSVFDEACDAIGKNATANADGTVTVHITADSVAAVKQAVKDAQDWKTQAKS